jgi:hypothetical protein
VQYTEAWSCYQFRRIELGEHIKQVFDESNQIYGAKKIKVVLGERGIATSDKMVGELMQEMNLQSIRADAHKITYDSIEKKQSCLNDAVFGSGAELSLGE